MEISVVISTYNRVDKLEMALQGLKAQTIASNLFNVYVIDNNSTDSTKQFVLNLKTKFEKVYYLELKQGLGFSRNTGYQLATGEYIAFLDDDAIPKKDWLFSILKNIKTHNSDCICGPIFPYYSTAKPIWFKDEYEIRSFSDNWLLFPRGTPWSGSNMTWRKSILQSLSGFNTNLGVSKKNFIPGEDTDLFYRYWEKFDGDIIYDPEVIILHWTPKFKLKTNYILKRIYMSGRTQILLNEEKPFISKIITFIQLITEIIISLLFFFPLKFKHKYTENWIIEESKRIFLRLGKLSALLSINIITLKQE